MPAHLLNISYFLFFCKLFSLDLKSITQSDFGGRLFKEAGFIFLFLGLFSSTSKWVVACSAAYRLPGKQNNRQGHFLEHLFIHILEFTRLFEKNSKMHY